MHDELAAVVSVWSCDRVVVSVEKNEMGGQRAGKREADSDENAESEEVSDHCQAQLVVVRVLCAVLLRVVALLFELCLCIDSGDESVACVVS